MDRWRCVDGCDFDLCPACFAESDPRPLEASTISSTDSSSLEDSKEKEETKT
jgi:hypothetical protein